MSPQWIKGKAIRAVVAVWKLRGKIHVLRCVVYYSVHRDMHTHMSSSYNINCWFRFSSFLLLTRATGLALLLLTRAILFELGHVSFMCFCIFSWLF